MNEIKTTCIIPAYNEGPRVSRTIEELLKIDLLDEIIVVNDGSTDDTLEQINKYKDETKLEIITYKGNKGKGYAVARGIDAANHELIVLVDADMFGFRRDHFQKLIDTVLVRGIDLVTATPFETSSLVGVLQSYIMPLGTPFMGIRAFRKSDIIAVLDKIRDSRYGIEMIMFSHFFRNNKKIKNVSLRGVRAFFKSEKEVAKGESKRVEAIIKGLYKELKMWRNVAKSGLEYPPLPNFEEFRTVVKSLLNRELRTDETFTYIDQEIKRQIEGLELIPSENYVSSAVLEALGSILTNKYSEGYPGKRYYGGNKYIDEVEKLAQKRALQVFGLNSDAWGVNVQPYSGSPANHAVYLGLLESGDTVMGLSLSSGGHLTHGYSVNFSAKYYNSVSYTVQENGEIDFNEVRELAEKHKPKLIWAGATAYTKNYDYGKFAEIAKEVGAYLAVDIAHVAGLIAADVHNSPFPHADVVTTTTHKTLRGPRGAMVFAKQELMDKINSAVFPGLQGGPHNHQTAAIAVSLGEALQPEFKEYGAQIVKNAKRLAKELMKLDIKLVGNGTENHLMLLDFSDFGGGRQVELALEYAGITVNKNTIPGDKNPPYYPSGVRLGTPAITSRGMVEDDMVIVAEFISRAVKEVIDWKLPEMKEDRGAMISRLKESLIDNKEIQQLRKDVREFSSLFPVPGITR